MKQDIAAALPENQTTDGRYKKGKKIEKSLPVQTEVYTSAGCARKALVIFCASFYCRGYFTCGLPGESYFLRCN